MATSKLNRSELVLPYRWKVGRWSFWQAIYNSGNNSRESKDSIAGVKEARAEITEVLLIDPKYTVRLVPRSFPWKDQAEIDRLIDSLRKTGLPG